MKKQRHKWIERKNDNATMTYTVRCKKCSLIKRQQWVQPYKGEYINTETGEITEEAPGCKEIQEIQMRIW